MQIILRFIIRLSRKIGIRKPFLTTKLKMESNKNNNNNGGDGQLQLRKSAQKRKLNELTNDGDKAAAGEEDQNGNSCSKKNREEGNYMDLEELESLSREELLKMVRKQMAMTTEAQTQLETTKKVAEESAIEEEQSGSKCVATNSSGNENTWYDWLAFVPRHQLGKIVPKVGDRKFAKIVQKFLHEYGEISLDIYDICPPYEEHPSDLCPRVRVQRECAYGNSHLLRMKMADVPMPKNIKSFDTLALSYFDIHVRNFIEKFQQNGLLDHVNLSIGDLCKDTHAPVLAHLLPLINDIISLEVAVSSQLLDIYSDKNSEEISELNIKMMEKTRFLGASHPYDELNLQPKKIALYCRWLYQTPREDGNPRVLILGRVEATLSPISLFLERIKKDFLMATHPIPFFIRINLPKAFKHQGDICMDNEKTSERLLTKMEEAKVPFLPADDDNEEDDDEEEEEEEVKVEEVVLLISRYPLGATKAWIEEKKKEVLDWNFHATTKTIYLSDDLKIGEI